jgi:glycosyltransferase involved in cell wall biosynthesis
MHLAYIVGTYPQPSETFIAREVAGMRARGHRVDVYSLFRPEAPDAETVYGWPTVLARAMRKAAGPAAVRALGRRWGARFAESGVDTVVAHFGSQPSTVALYTGDLPLLLSLHARDIYVEAERLDEKIARAKAVVTCCEVNVRALRARFPDAPLHRVYHGLPRAWLDAPIPTRERAPGAPLRILAVGRLVEKKGFHLLPADLHPRIIGDGPLRARLEALGLVPEGWQSQAAIRDAYAWADVLVCPSLIAADGDRDGLPNVVVEAMSTGLPVVGTDVSGIPEAVLDGVTGFIAPVDGLADALARYTDPDLRACHGAAAAAHVRAHFAAEAGYAQLEALLR